MFRKKIYSNIDKYHTTIALLAPFDKTGRKKVMKTSVAYDSKCRAHWTQEMWRFGRSREKSYITACELSVTRLPHERYHFIGGTKF